MMIRLTFLCLTIPLLVGCTSPTVEVAPLPTASPSSSGLENVTFFVGGMNHKLKIL